KGQNRRVAWRSAIHAFGKGSKIYLDGMGAGIRCPDQNRILVLSQISRAAIDHACIDLTGARRKYLNHAPELIVLAVGSDNLDGKRATLHRRVFVIGDSIGRVIDNVDASVAIEIGQRHAPRSARLASELACGYFREAAFVISKDRAARVVAG